MLRTCILVALLGLTALGLSPTASAEQCIVSPDIACASLSAVDETYYCSQARGEVGGWGGATVCLPITRFVRPFAEVYI